MKVCVNEILKQGLNFERELDPAALGLETLLVHYPSGIKVKAHLEKEKDVVYAKVYIKTKENIVCSKCLEQFDSIFKKEVDFVYKLENKHTINLYDNIRDTIILEHSIRQLCKDDCKGLCQICGSNLNNDECSCAKIKGV